MTRLIRRVVVVLVVLGVVSAAALAQEADKYARMEEHYKAGIRAFMAGEYQKAALEFEKVLAEDPSALDALKLRDLAEVRFYSQVMRKGSPKMRSDVLRLLRRASDADKERLTDPVRIKALIKALLGDFEKRSAAYAELVSSGEYAVPHLVDWLLDPRRPEYSRYHVRVTVALIRIGEEGVLPLCTALRADSVPLRQDVCFVLGQIGDPRAVPYLLRAAKSDPAPEVRATAADALAEMKTTTEVADELAHVGLFRLARLYYYGDPSVQRSQRFDSIVWNWSPTKKRLVMEVVPEFLYSVAMARGVANEALLSAPEYEPVLPLLISTYHKEIVNIRRRMDMAESDPKQALSEMEKRQLNDRLKKSKNILLTLRSAGEKHFYRALSLQLSDARPELAAAVIDDLALVASPDLKPYTDPPELFEPLRPAVIKPAPSTAAGAPAAADGQGEGESGKPTGGARSAIAKRDAMRLFGTEVRKEAQRIVRAPRAPVKATAGAPASWQEIIASARRLREERRRADAKAAVPEADTTTTVQAGPLARALRSSDKGVRYGAAAALARIMPNREFLGSRTVVEILGQAITEKGHSSVLIVSEDDQAANRLVSIAREAGHVPHAERSTVGTMRTVRRSPPKDLIVLDEAMASTLDTLRKDPAVVGIPVIVFTKDEDTTAAAQTFAGKAVAVLRLNDSKSRIKTVMSRAIVGDQRTVTEGSRLAKQYAHVAAEALESIPATGTPFSRHLGVIKDDLKTVLDTSTDPYVRIRAIGVLGKARLTVLMGRLIAMCQEASRLPDERRACIAAIGSMLDPTKTAPPAVVNLLRVIHAGGDPGLRLFAVQRLRSAAIPAAELERLINEQEAAEPGAAAPGAG